MKVFSGIVTHDATASATIFVMAENAEDAAEEVIEAAQNGAGNFEWNDGNYISDYYLGGGQSDIEEVGEIKEINSLEDWVSSKPGTLVYWPTNGDQPYTRQAFEDICYNNPNWAYKLYRHCIEGEGAYHPTTFIDEAGGVEDLLFGDEGNFMKLKRLLEQADAVTIDDGPLLTSWDADWDAGEDDTVVHFSWTDGEYQYQAQLERGGIASGDFENGAFTCEDHEGEKTTIKMFTLESLI